MALPRTSKTSAGWLGQLSPPGEMEVSIRLSCFRSLGRPPKTPAISADLRQPLLWIANPLEIPLTMIFSEHFPFSPPSPAPSQRILRAGLSLEIEICATQYIGSVAYRPGGNESNQIISDLLSQPTFNCFTCLPLCLVEIGNFSLTSILPMLHYHLHLRRCSSLHLPMVSYF